MIRPITKPFELQQLLHEYVEKGIKKGTIVDINYKESTGDLLTLKIKGGDTVHLTPKSSVTIKKTPLGLKIIQTLKKKIWIGEGADRLTGSVTTITNSGNVKQKRLTETLKFDDPWY